MFLENDYQLRDSEDRSETQKGSLDAPRKLVQHLIGETQTPPTENARFAYREGYYEADGSSVTEGASYQVNAFQSREYQVTRYSNLNLERPKTQGTLKRQSIDTFVQQLEYQSKEEIKNSPGPGQKLEVRQRHETFGPESLVVPQYERNARAGSQCYLPVEAESNENG